MDQQARRDVFGRSDADDRAVSRRAFFSRARLGLLAVAGVAVFGIGMPIGDATADEDDEKKEKEEARDKDREAKEKERETEQKEKKKKKKTKSSSKDEENKSNTKKKKAKNGDDSNKKKKKKKAKNPYGNSSYGKYIVKDEDKHGCTAFPNQFDAQQVLRLEPKDPNNLDGNRNGIACDGQDAFMDAVPGGLMNGPFDLNPVPRP
jgi:hypothetical protein